MSFIPGARVAQPSTSESTDVEEDLHQQQIELQSFFPHTTTSFDPNDYSLNVDNIHPVWKRHLHELMEHPNSSQAAILLHILITFLILFSAGVTILETIPFFHYTSPGVWFGIETGLVALFTVEYIARTVAWSGSYKTLFRWVVCAFLDNLIDQADIFSSSAFFGIIDLLAILPYYIEIVLGVDTVRPSLSRSH